MLASLKFLDGAHFQQNEKSLGLTQEKFLPQLHGQLPQEQVYAAIGSDVSDEQNEKGRAPASVRENRERPSPEGCNDYR